MYGPEIPGGKIKGFRVPPPGEGACQGGYGGVWLSLAYDDDTTPVEQTIPARAVGINFDGGVFPLFGKNEVVDVSKKGTVVQLPKRTASVSIRNKSGNPDHVITTMIEAEVRGVPAK